MSFKKGKLALLTLEKRYEKCKFDRNELGYMQVFAYNIEKVNDIFYEEFEVRRGEWVEDYVMDFMEAYGNE
eukprot:Pgem_evm2s20071